MCALQAYHPMPSRGFCVSKSLTLSAAPSLTFIVHDFPALAAFVCVVGLVSHAHGHLGSLRSGSSCAFSATTSDWRPPSTWQRRLCQTGGIAAARRAPEGETRRVPPSEVISAAAASNNSDAKLSAAAQTATARVEQNTQDWLVFGYLWREDSYDV